MHRALFSVVAVFLALIGLVLLLNPESYLSIYVIDYDTGMDFAARRFAPVVLAMAVVLWLARNLSDFVFVKQLCWMAVLAFWAVAATGVHAWATGQAGAAILVAAATEVVVGALFVVAATRLAKA